MLRVKPYWVKHHVQKKLCMLVFLPLIIVAWVIDALWNHKEHVKSDLKEYYHLWSQRC